MKKAEVSGKHKVLLCLLLLCLCTVVNIHAQDTIDLDQLSADEEFKWGVNAYHRGLFNEAARAFEKALSYKPESSIVQRWLGMAWYRTGFTDEALNIWETIEQAGSADSILMNRLEILKQRTGIETEPPSERFLPAMKLDGVFEDYTLFKRPSSVFPGSNGDFYISAYGTNEILRFNSNGALTARINGGLEGFNHPFDVRLAENGYLYVTEFNGDRITRCTTSGRDIFRFGESGTGKAQLLGPQYLAFDEKGYLYVTESGNSRVSKYDLDGNYILSFGRRTYDFDGLLMPTGIFCTDGYVYVADSRKADISIFDYSGNYISSTGSGILIAPEGLSRLDARNLLVADRTRIMSLDLKTGIIRPVSDLEGEGRNLLKAAIDSNGNLLTTDFDQNRITVLTGLSNMYSGLFVQIDRIDAGGYPSVVVDLRIQDRDGKPFVGLAANNFVLTENGYPANEPELVYTGNTVSNLDISVLIDSRMEMKDFQPDIIKAVDSLMNSHQRGSMKLVSSGMNPVTEADYAEGARKFMAAASSDGFYSAEAVFDAGLRHAASELINLRGRRAVVYVTDGTVSGNAFAQYHPVELAGLLENNGISFYCVLVSNQNDLAEELQYICEETGGDYFYLYQPKGLGDFEKQLLKKPDGSYTLVFDSAHSYLGPDEFIPVEVEAFLYNRSGRETSGYYNPGKR